MARSLGERSWPALVERVDAIGRELLDAARSGRAEDVYRLLEAGAPPNARDPQSGDTALHLAAAGGWLDALDYLVGWIPVDKHARTRAGRTALGACVAGAADRWWSTTVSFYEALGLGLERYPPDRCYYAPLD